MTKKYDAIWFTGQPGAGKTELGQRLCKHLEETHGTKHVILDGDDIRELFNNTDYSVAGRRQNVELVQKLCLYLNKNAIVPVVCMVSPFLDQREELKAKLSVLEVFVFCHELRGREHFHVDYYQQPEHGYISIDTTGKTVEVSFGELLKKIST